MSQVVHDFPLAALVGQEQLKYALLVCAVNPGIGGVLIRGDKGSAKSTAARGLAGVMAPIARVSGCLYNCAPGEPAVGCEICNGAQPTLETTPVPFVNLPLGASEDRVLGSLDFERALKDGRKSFQPGLLASAHRGILYIDEVNLLPDHLVDVLLDTAAMGVNRVQREGLSVQHPARIALVGTMNQEEGELRPQLLDRFGMMVEVRAPQEPRVRTEIVRRRLAWEADPEAFARAWQSQQSALRDQVLRAQALLPEVSISEGLLELISELCCSQGVTSLRADLVMNKASRALAALHGRKRVEPDDLSQAAMLVLPHRRRARPFEQPGLDEEALQRVMQRGPGESSSDDGDGSGGADAGNAGKGAQRDKRDPAGPGSARGAGDGGRDARDGGDPSRNARGAGDAGRGARGGAGECHGGGADAGNAQAGTGSSGPKGPHAASEARDTGDARDAGDAEAPQQVFSAKAAAPPPRIELKSGLVSGGVVGRRSVALESRRGRELRAVPNTRPSDLAVTATLHHSLLRTGGLSPDGRLEVAAEDLHQKVRSGRQGSLILFVVDASGSMAALQRMEMVKGTVLALLRDAYERRDEVSVIAFRGMKAELLLAPTRSVEIAERQLRELPTGGRTPLAHALQVASDVLNQHSGASRPQPLLIVLSDGKANVPLDGTGDAWEQSLQYAQAFARKNIAALVLDTEVGFVRMGRAQDLAKALNTSCLSLEDLSAERLTLTIRGHMQASRRTQP